MFRYFERIILSKNLILLKKIILEMNQAFKSKEIKDRLYIKMDVNFKPELHIKIMGYVNLKIIDCCSKEEYINKYFTTKKQKIFSHVDILLFVVDATEKDHQLSLNYFKK